MEADAKHKPLRSVRNVSDISQGSVATCSRFGRVSKGLDFCCILAAEFCGERVLKIALIIWQTHRHKCSTSPTVS